MNILYINHYAGSLYHGMEYRPYYLAREWVRQGHKVTIVASNYSHIRQKNIELPVGQNYAYETLDGIDYIWCRTPVYGENGLKRVVNIFAFLNRVKAIRSQLVRELQPDVVIASSTYPFDVKVAAQLAHAARAKLVYEVHDLWPLTPVEVGGMSKWHPFILAMQRAENFAYRRADKVVSLLPKADGYMQEHGMAPDKFVCIPNGVAVADWESGGHGLATEHQNTMDALRQLGKFIIGYAGGMGEANALDDLLSAAKLIREQPLSLVLIGDGPLKETLRARIAQEGLHNVALLPSISKQQIPAFLAACDALYIGWNKLAIYRFGICPNKLFDYMLAQKPIIHSVTAGNDLVAEAHCGISVAAADVPAIAEALLAMSNVSAAERAEYGRNGAKFVRQHHDYSILASRFLAALDD